MKKLLLSFILITLILSVKSQSTIYGIEYDTLLNVNYFVSVNPNTGVITQIDSLSGVENFNDGSSAFNSASQYYIFTDKKDIIYTIDINTGAILARPTLTASIKDLHYDAISNNYYALEFVDTVITMAGTGPSSGSNINIAKTYLVNLNPTTGIVTRIDSIPGVNQISISCSAYDYNSKLFTLVSNKGEIHSIDVNTGAIISSANLSTTIHELQFNVSTGNYYAIENVIPTTGNATDTAFGSTSTSAQANKTYLVNVTPSTGVVTRIDSVQGLYNFEIGTSSIDTVNGLYSIINQDNKLFSIDISDAIVSLNPQLNSALHNLKINAILGGGRIAEPTFDQMQAYPNPARNQLRINVNMTPTTLTIYNRNGILIENKTLISNSNSVNISGFETGLYYFILNNEETSETKKIMVQ